MKVKLVGAYSKGNRAMGLNGKLPWRYKSDLKSFKENVKDCILVCGPKTALEVSFLKQPMVVWYDHVPFTDLMRFAMSAALEKGCDVAIVGGAKVFELGMFWASELILTEIQKDYEGDVFFPEIQEDKFKLVSELYHEDEPELVWKVWRRK